MKKVPMILLLITPYTVLTVCYVMRLDIMIGLCVYGALLVFNMVYAFAMPKLGFTGKQILFWNLVLKLCNIPLVILILLFTLIMTMVGGELRPSIAGIGLLSCYLIELSSGMFGISSLRWFHKSGTLSKGGMTVSLIAQFVPCVDVVASILCYTILRKY